MQTDSKLHIPKTATKAIGNYFATINFESPRGPVVTYGCVSNTLHRQFSDSYEQWLAAEELYNAIDELYIKAHLAVTAAGAA